jgi:hypothetical protein
MTPQTPLLIACAALSAIAVALLVLLLLRRKRDTLREIDAVTRLDLVINVLDEKLNAADVLTVAELTPIAEGLEKLRGGIAGLQRVVERAIATPPPPPPPPADAVALEHQILAESWKKFRADQELSAAFDDAMTDRAWTQLIDELTNVVPADLQPTFDAVIGPCREHRTLVQQIGLIPRVLSGTFPRLATDAEEVWRTRELASLLTAENTQRLDFRFRSWVTDAFLPFADLYLQRYQQARFEHGDGALEAGADLVRKVLRAAAVEAIDVTPGETLFDSARHVGRSTTNDPRFPDGVITGVVRNGFIEGGQQVIRQPEVIVNRMR